MFQQRHATSPRKAFPYVNCTIQAIHQTNMSWLSISNMFPGIPWPCWCRFLSSWAVMAVCTPRPPTPTTTRWDQRPRTGWAQWWVDDSARSCASRSLVASPPSHPDDTFCQQAGLYRGGYNRFTPYWGAARPWEEEQPDGWLSDQLAVQLIPWRCRTQSLGRWRNVSRCHAPYWRGWTGGRCKYCGTHSESVLLKL